MMLLKCNINNSSIKIMTDIPNAFLSIFEKLPFKATASVAVASGFVASTPPRAHPSAHYSKSQIFVQKFNLDQTPTFSRVFHPIFF